MFLRGSDWPGSGSLKSQRGGGSLAFPLTAAPLQGSPSVLASVVLQFSVLEQLVMGSWILGVNKQKGKYTQLPEVVFQTLRTTCVIFVMCLLTFPCVTSLPLVMAIGKMDCCPLSLILPSSSHQTTGKPSNHWIS